MTRSNLWAPWRISYIKGLDKKQDCFICHCIKNPQDDKENLILWRTRHFIVMFNRYPYNNGHLLLASIGHIAGLEQLDESQMLEVTKLIVACQKVLTIAVKPHGFNVGLNLGRSAGAGLPEHLHIHIVPRWEGDTNFMDVCADTNVISQSMKELYQQMKTISVENNLPGL